MPEGAFTFEVMVGLGVLGEPELAPPVETGVRRGRYECMEPCCCPGLVVGVAAVLLLYVGYSFEAVTQAEGE